MGSWGPWVIGLPVLIVYSVCFIGGGFSKGKKK
jgi:hypothetical protein